MKTIAYVASMLLTVVIGAGCGVSSEADHWSEETSTEANENFSTHSSELGGGAGSPCNADGECHVATVCNTYLSQCAFPGGAGTRCLRDYECHVSTVCNSYSQQCAFQGGVGTRCLRDNECHVATVCNTYSQQCAWKGGLGTRCQRGYECVSGVCNTATKQCM